MNARAAGQSMSLPAPAHSPRDGAHKEGLAGGMVITQFHHHSQFINEPSA
jgi:hypothetical protein